MNDVDRIILRILRELNLDEFDSTYENGITKELPSTEHDLIRIYNRIMEINANTREATKLLQTIND